MHDGPGLRSGRLRREQRIGDVSGAELRNGYDGLARF